MERPPERDLTAEPSPKTWTRLTLWPEYGALVDGEVLATVVRAPGAEWRGLAAAEAARRGLLLRMRALATAGPPGFLRTAAVSLLEVGEQLSGRPQRCAQLELDDGCIYVTAPSEMRVDGMDQVPIALAPLEVQVAARFRKHFHVDTLFGPLVQNPLDLADALVGWLAAHGAPIFDVDAAALRAAEAAAHAHAGQARSVCNYQRSRGGHMVSSNPVPAQTSPRRQLPRP
mmetsp:Transcript_15058/g.44959  ORF Transcript_15058/g.44959 Transcript_15058/m.44959 type:complete len:229 (-) Transcript_15058:869-1555(-)